MVDLKPQYQAYAHAILAGETEMQAAITAGYKATNAHIQGNRLFKNVEIQAYIRERLAGASERAEVDIARTLREIAGIAFAHLRDAVSWDPDGMTLVPSSELDETTSAAIKEVRVLRTITRTKDGGEIERVEHSIKLHDKNSALEKLAKTLNMYEEHNDRKIIIEQVRSLAREVGADEDAAVEEAERWLAAQV